MIIVDRSRVSFVFVVSELETERSSLRDKCYAPFLLFFPWLCGLTSANIPRFSVVITSLSMVYHLRTRPLIPSDYRTHVSWREELHASITF
jgi:hypothetical protein